MQYIITITIYCLLLNFMSFLGLLIFPGFFAFSLFKIKPFERVIRVQFRIYFRRRVCLYKMRCNNFLKLSLCNRFYTLSGFPTIVGVSKYLVKI